MDRKPTMTNTKKGNASAVSMRRDETQRHLAYMCVDRSTASAKNRWELKASNVGKARTCTEAIPWFMREMLVRLYLWRFFYSRARSIQRKIWRRIVYRGKKEMCMGCGLYMSIDFWPSHSHFIWWIIDFYVDRNSWWDRGRKCKQLVQFHLASK